MTPNPAKWRPMPAGPVWRPCRRFLRFSVRGLIVLVLVVGAGLGWLVREARIQRDAVAAIKRAGGSVRYDWEWRNGNAAPRNCPPKWLEDSLGVDYFGQVVVVALTPSAPDAALAHIGRLHGLVSLTLRESSVCDAGLAHLKDLTNLSF
jgi:hypothetical protein